MNKTLGQYQIMSDIETNHPILNNKIIEGFEEYNYYLEYLKDEKFENKLNETEEESIKRAESIYDRLDEMIKRNDSSNKKANETIRILNKMAELFNEIVKNNKIEKEKLIARNNELIDEIIVLEQRKIKKLINCNPRRQGTYKGMLEDVTNEWVEHKIIRKETIPKQKIQQIFVQPLYIFDNNEMKQIESWTRMKIGNIIFNSDVDNWNKETSVFNRRVMNKSNLIFLIEDEDGNKFGGCVNTKICGCVEWISDSKSFLFSLKSNGRLNGMMKFELKIHNMRFN